VADRLPREDVTMSRLPFQTREALDDDGQGVWDSITASRGSIVTETAHCRAFNVVTAPGIGGRLAELGLALVQSSIGGASSEWPSSLGLAGGVQDSGRIRMALHSA
jgi:hypothetical protein